MTESYQRVGRSYIDTVAPDSRMDIIDESLMMSVGRFHLDVSLLKFSEYDVTSDDVTWPTLIMSLFLINLKSVDITLLLLKNNVKLSQLKFVHHRKFIYFNNLLKF